MTIVKSTGCTSFYTNIDGVNVSHQSISDELEIKIKDSLMAFINQQDKEELIFFVESMVDWYGYCTYESTEACETCGDYVTENTLELP